MHRAVKYTLFNLIYAVDIKTHIMIPRIEKHTFFPNFAVFDTLFNVLGFIDR